MSTDTICPSCSRPLEERLISANKENEKLKAENQKLTQYNQTVTKELKTLAEQVSGLSEESRILDQNKEKLNSNIKDLQAWAEKTKEAEFQYNELINKMGLLKNEMGILQNEKTILKQDIKRRKVQQEQLDEEMTNSDQRPKVAENMQILQYREDKIDPEDFKEHYDCRIIADSFYTLLKDKSWPIEYKNYKEYSMLKEQNTTKVAVLGYENTGKSFILSKLTGSELPQGKLTKTVGLCLKYPKESYLPWTALDTPGTNISVKVQQMKENLAYYFQKKNLPNEERLRMLLGDNILMENLLQEFVVSHAQVLLVVIGKLHRDDQRLVNRIKSLPGKRIIIVHNLMDARKIEDVEDMIREDITETFSVTEKPIYLEKVEAGKGKEMNNKVYLENDEKSEKAIEHIVMAHAGSPAGDYYNESAITYIKTTITSTPFVQPFDLVQAFVAHLNEHVKNYLHSKNPEKDTPFVFEADDNKVAKAIKLNDHQQYDLKLSSADEFGQIRTFAREGLENVPHTVKIIRQETDAGMQNVLRVEFEIVGKYKEENIRCRTHPMLNNQIRVEIRGKSEDNTTRRENERILENNRKFGDFTILTDPIDLDGLVINAREKCDRINTEVPGLMILSWNLYTPAEDSW